MKRPRLLDLFCGAGGCSVGYHRAGFDVVGVDIKPQPRYPFRFVQADALEYLAEHGREYDAIHASPPCQRYSQATRRNKGREGIKQSAEHPDLVGPTRELLAEIAKPWVIENVVGAPLHDPLLLCGTFFGLRVIRHRLFESSIFLWGPGQRCWHPKRGKVGHAGERNKQVGDWTSVAGSCCVRVGRHAMGIDWVTKRDELSQMIPPAYTEFIGRQLMKRIREATDDRPKPC